MRPVGPARGRAGSAVGTLAVAAVLLAGCRGGAAAAAAPSPSSADPVGSIEATISSVESGFADDAGAGR